MEFIKIGEIINTFGIKGELKVKSFSDFEDKRYKNGSTVYIGQEKEALIVESFKHHKGFTLLKLKDLDNINFVLKYKGKEIFTSLDDIKPLTDGRYYFKDLVNLDVRVNEKVIGKCLYVEEGISSNYLVVKKNDGEERLVPFVKEAIIKEVNLNDKYIEVVEMEGLL